MRKSIGQFIGLYLCLFSFTHALHAETVSLATMNTNPKAVSAGISYLIPLGNVADYYKHNFGYNVSYEHLLTENGLGSFGFDSSLNYYALKSDDIREFSRLHMFMFSAGVNQALYENSWFKKLSRPCSRTDLLVCQE